MIIIAITIYIYICYRTLITTIYDRGQRVGHGAEAEQVPDARIIIISSNIYIYMCIHIYIYIHKYV